MTDPATDVQLERLTTDDLARPGEGPKQRRRLLLVPLGATEQHGPHLPLGTDTMIASHWADGVAEACNGHPRWQVVVAPALPYGSSGEHQMFPGTLSIGQAALELLLVELVRSAVATFDRVAFLSGHAGNLEPVTAATERMNGEGHDVHHLFPAWPTGWPDPIDAHAGRTETSLMLHLRPGDVRRELVVPGDTRPLGDVLATLQAEGTAAVSPNGVLGDPTGADADQGRALLEALVSRTVEAITATADGSEA